jgi:hypothetical protein
MAGNGYPITHPNKKTRFKINFIFTSKQPSWDTYQQSYIPELPAHENLNTGPSSAHEIPI